MKRHISTLLFFGLLTMSGSLRAHGPSVGTDVVLHHDLRTYGPVAGEPSGTDQKATPFRMPATPRKTTAPK